MTSTPIHHVISETMTRRAEARTLLCALVDAKKEVERAADGTTVDVFKDVTGQSSIDRAIDRARRLIDSFSRVLDDLLADLTDEDLALLKEIRSEHDNPPKSTRPTSVNFDKPKT